MLKAGFVSLGCAKNLVDTEVMLGLLADNNISVIDNPREADILIVNTCGFIEAAKEESISTIFQLATYKKTGKCRCLVVTGCLGERYRQELLAEMPEIDAIVGTGSWHRIVQAVKEGLAGGRPAFFDDHSRLYDENTPRISTQPFYSTFVKIADGCDNCCSYCIIPQVRGKLHSRSRESVVNEVGSMVKKGLKEVNLIAQDTTSYGRDIYGSPQLYELLRQLTKIDELVWIRLLYCYPKYFTDELIDLIAREPKICNYIDLPLQHVNDEILQAMNRRDRRYDIELLLSKIKRKIPGVAIRTSLIVGFPGETEKQFNELRDFVIQQKFDHVGVFPYSQEENTIAAKLANQIPEAVKQDRYHELMAIQSRNSEIKNRSLEGKNFAILVEGRNTEQPEVVYGRTYREAPGVDGRVYVENAPESRPGDLIFGKIAQGFAYDLVAEKIIK